MQRKFLGNLILLLFLNFLIKPFWIFGIDRTVQNLVGTEQYGLYYALFNFSFLFNIFLDLGITNFNNRNISQNSFLLSKHFPNIVGLKISLGILYGIVTVISGLVMNYDWQAMQILFVLIFNQFLISFTLYLRSNISGLQLFKTDSILSATDRFLMLIFCGFLILFKTENFQLEWFIYSQTAAYIVTFFASFFIVVKHSKFKKPNFNIGFYTTIIKQSFPYASLIFVMILYYKTDTVMLQKMLPNGNYHSGLYAQGYRLFEALTMVPYLFSLLLLPMFSKMTKDKQNVNDLVNLSLKLLIGGAVVLSTTLFLFSENIISSLYVDFSIESINAFSYLILGFIPVSIGYIYGTLLTANGNLKQLNILALGSLMLNLILNFILIPEYKSEGAALASFATQSLSAVVQIYFASKLCKTKNNISLLFKLIALVLIVISTHHITSMYNLGFIYSLSITISIGVLCSMLLKIISVGELKNLLLQPKI